MPKVETKLGTGEIISPREVRYTDSSGKSEIVSTQNIIIAWGSQPQMLPGINPSERVLTSDGILNLNLLPPNIIIVGGSFIGVEFATFFAELGVKVNLVELLEQILPNEDQETVDLLRQDLIRLGINIHTSTKLESLKDTDSGVVVQAQKNGEQLELNADYALLCYGQKAFIAFKGARQCGD